MEGVWNFPQIPDNISLNSYEDDTEDADIESTLSTSLPDTDISFFDPLSTDHDDPDDEKPNFHTSGSWLFAAMNTCAGIVLICFLTIYFLQMLVIFLCSFCDQFPDINIKLVNKFMHFSLKI